MKKVEVDMSPNGKIEKNRNLLLLGFVSLFTDLSSQMIYPLVPAFLTQIGATGTIIGLIEGIAESVSSLFRAVFGKLSDQLGKRKVFVYAGYGLSSLAKPLLFLASAWGHVLFIRFFDRIGKAIRNPARDALISTSVEPDRKGIAFGWHRAMDRLGAMGGPLLALLILHSTDDDLRLVFLWAGVPAILALTFVPFVKEMSIQPGTGSSAKIQSLWDNKAFTWFFIASIAFTLGNSSNAFLLLKAGEVGISLSWIPLLWMVYNLMAAISSPMMGYVSDKVGRKPVIAISFAYYVGIYTAFALSDQPLEVWLLFGLYGIYYGLSNGVYRAYLADLIKPENRGAAYGIFNTGIGLALFPASLIMGLIWDAYGSKWAFIISAIFSLVGLMLFLVSAKLCMTKSKKALS